MANFRLWNEDQVISWLSTEVGPMQAAMADQRVDANSLFVRAVDVAQLSLTRHEFAANFEAVALAVLRSDVALTPSAALSVSDCRFAHQTRALSSCVSRTCSPTTRSPSRTADSAAPRSASSSEPLTLRRRTALSPSLCATRALPSLALIRPSDTISDDVGSGSHRGAACFVNNSFELSDGLNSRDTASAQYRVVLEVSRFADNCFVADLIALASPAASMLLLRNALDGLDLAHLVRWLSVLGFCAVC